MSSKGLKENIIEEGNYFWPLDGIVPDGDEPPLDVYNDFVTGLNMGIALPLHMLTYLRDLGITDQVGHSSLGFIDQTVQDAEGNTQYVNLPGMLRDIAAQSTLCDDPLEPHTGGRCG